MGATLRVKLFRRRGGGSLVWAPPIRWKLQVRTELQGRAQGQNLMLLLTRIEKEISNAQDMA